MKKSILMYITGLLDGEGTITLEKSGKFRHPLISISNTSLAILDTINSFHKGTIKKCHKQKEHYLQAYEWQLRSNKAITFLQRIYPYIIHESKKYRASLILNEYKSVTPRNGKYSKEQLVKKQDFEYRFFHPSNTLDKSVGIL